MKLTKIYFDAFKSLLKKEIELEHNCIGFVGTNESGKSNVLLAINTLGGNRKLTIKDTPKMSRDNIPSLKFVLNPNENDKKEISEIINEWSEINTLVRSNIKLTNFNILYEISYNKQKQTEERSFILDNIEIANKDYLILKEEFYKDIYKLKTKESFIPLHKAIIVKKRDIENAEKYNEIFKNLKKLNDEINHLETSISEKKAIKKEIEVKTTEIKDEIPALLNKEVIVVKEVAKLQKLKDEKSKLELEIQDFNIEQILLKADKDIIDLIDKITSIKGKISQTKVTIAQFENRELTDPAQKKTLTVSKKNLEKFKTDLFVLSSSLKSKEKEYHNLKIPLNEKYTSDLSELNKYLSNILFDKINTLLPRVIFWKHSAEYIIQSETQFDELLSKSNLNEISRPLVNVFRIGLQISTIEDLKAGINEIRIDSNERSKKERKLNTEVNKYIKSVWSDYDQDIKISLEKDQIRIEVFDPNYEDRSYYNMEERSQGAQTFISFLLTIGAEAKQGVIRGNILLLDEPETHLHPSGVRFMLKELLKISENDNIVMYATHSIFMIDRDNYDRHIILEKRKERTIIKPAKIDRIGFFMQEEVLYKTLDIDLRKDFTSTKRINFVFEGYGDAILFEYFYTKIHLDHPYPLKNTSFYQGGKCSDIQKYLSQNPIQLGTKWIFIIDKDQPAEALKKFIEGKYKDYLDKDIYVFQYNKDIKGNNSPVIELEDILPISIIKQSYLSTVNSLELDIKEKIIDDILKMHLLYVDYNKEILDLVNGDIDENIFKGKFKTILNSVILSKIADKKDKDYYKKEFEIYSNWTNELIIKLKDTK